jgi:hypothetical protein
MSTFITPNFSFAELACHDGTDVPVELHPNVRLLCKTLELIRARWGGPIVVISGYRTRSYNVGIGGARMSFHCDALAADVRPVGGVGDYPGKWTHVDCRHRSPSRPLHIARWTGKGQGAEQTT